MLKNGFFSLFFFVSFVAVISLTFIEPRIGAAESEKHFMKDLVSMLRLEVDKETGQTDKTGLSTHEKIYSKFLPHVQLPLNNRLRLFYNLYVVNKDSYERRDNDKKCSIFGIDISF
jgi:hypothetical protein